MVEPAPALLMMEDVMLDLLRVTGRLPRQVRHTLAQRIVHLARISHDNEVLVTLGLRQGLRPGLTG